MQNGMMKTVRVWKFGAPESLCTEQVPSPEVKFGEVLVEVEASGVGFADVMLRAGMYPGAAKEGIVPGLEIAGKIASVGEGVDSRWLGQRVYAMVASGGYAEKIALRIDQIVPLADALGAAESVSLGVNAIVAKLALERGGLNCGDEVLVRGASGGIGLMTVQVAASKGAKVTAITSSSEKGARLRQYGATKIVDRLEETAVLEKYDIVIDPVAGSDLSTYLSKLKRGGRYVLVGVAGGLPDAGFGMTLLKNFQNSGIFSTFSLDSVEPAEIIASFAEIFQAAVTGTIKPVIDEIFQFENAAAAHHKLESGKVFGKIALTPASAG